MSAQEITETIRKLSPGEKYTILPEPRGNMSSAFHTVAQEDWKMQETPACYTTIKNLYIWQKTLPKAWKTLQQQYQLWLILREKQTLNRTGLYPQMCPRDNYTLWQTVRCMARWIREAWWTRQPGKCTDFAYTNGKPQRGASDSSTLPANEMCYIHVPSDREWAAWGRVAKHMILRGHCPRYQTSQILQHNGWWSPLPHPRANCILCEIADGENNIRRVPQVQQAHQTYWRTHRLGNTTVLWGVWHSNPGHARAEIRWCLQTGHPIDSEYRPISKSMFHQRPMSTAVHLPWIWSSATYVPSLKYVLVWTSSRIAACFCSTAPKNWSPWASGER